MFSISAEWFISRYKTHQITLFYNYLDSVFCLDGGTGSKTLAGSGDGGRCRARHSLSPWMKLSCL